MEFLYSGENFENEKEYLFMHLRAYLVLGEWLWKYGIAGAGI